MTSSIDVFVNKQVSVLTNDSRHYVGVFTGFDQATNLILTHSKLLVWETGQPLSQVDTHAITIRGDTVAAVFLVEDNAFPETADTIPEFIH